jgi:hypothetical protein
MSKHSFFNKALKLERAPSQEEGRVGLLLAGRRAGGAAWDALCVDLLFFELAGGARRL